MHGPVVRGLTKFKRLVLIGLTLALVGVFVALIGMRVQSNKVERLAEVNRQILIEMAISNEANCKIRSEQLKRAATSGAASRKFLEDVGRKLAADGNPQTAKFVAEEVKRRAPIQPPAVVDCSKFRKTLDGK
jgi:hypothetical protein